MGALEKCAALPYQEALVLFWYEITPLLTMTPSKLDSVQLSESAKTTLN